MQSRWHKVRRHCVRSSRAGVGTNAAPTRRARVTARQMVVNPQPRVEAPAPMRDPRPPAQPGTPSREPTLETRQPVVVHSGGYPLTGYLLLGGRGPAARCLELTRSNDTAKSIQARGTSPPVFPEGRGRLH